eukprot:gnl/MRDRNA2_/MRDRNA2_125340_c0_seq1.p1 gnl/MRDRNA2_/MRDRNA2_125340_c0~~gnl/MRDRNA2_/MRDRNA2_125340_c0_seq1.p1  ORF type:complete len:171 (+),score=24.29 gnl/MRDRNA2_/MRDRNA2_125340_c0_seq1:144-656(+)
MMAPRAIANVLLWFLVQANSRDPPSKSVSGTAQDTPDKTLNELADRLSTRALQVLPVDGTDLESTTFAKSPGHLELPMTSVVGNFCNCCCELVLGKEASMSNAAPARLLKEKPEPKIYKVPNRPQVEVHAGPPKCRICGNMHGVINKYRLKVCRQCFRENAKLMGWVTNR